MSTRRMTPAERTCDLLGSAARAMPGYLADSRPHVAVHCAADIARMADELLADAVRNARAQGYAWSTIAEALGVSKQAAHKRFAHLDQT